MKAARAGGLLLLAGLLLGAVPVAGADPVKPAGEPDETRRAVPREETGLTGALSLSQVLAEVLMKNPELQAFSLEVRAREAAALQAGLLPNPAFSVQAEDITGSGDFDSFRRTQTTVQISQPLLLGHKIERRKRAAILNRDLADWDYRARRLDVLTRAGKTFIDVLTWQEQLALNRKLVQLAERNLEVMRLRVKAGKVSPIHEVKARVALANTRLELTRSENELAGARRRLASTWAAREPRFQKLLGDLYRVEPLVEFESLQSRIENNPDLARWATETRQREANLAVAESRALPNLQLQGAYRRIEEEQANTFVVGFQVPLQLFNRNQGAIVEARLRLDKAAVERRARRLALQTALAAAYNQLKTAHRQVTTLKNEVLPNAKVSFDAVNEGYRSGKFSLLDVLDSQRTFFQAQSRYVETLGRYHQAALEVKRLVGEPLVPEEARLELKPEGPQP